MTATKKKTIGKMTKAEARVEIAKDVLKHLRSLNVEEGYYLDGGYEPIRGVGSKDDAQKYINKMAKCRVCALGACLISHVRLFDQVPIRRLGRFYEGEFEFASERPTQILAKFFSQEQIDLIEAAFEQTRTHCQSPKTDDEEIYRAVMFGNKHADAKERLKAIMKNIIANAGTFRPEQE